MKRKPRPTPLTRRDFLKKSTLAAGAALFMPTIVPSSVFGANAPSNRIMMGFIGLRSQGTNNMKGFLVKSGCHVAAVCDVDQAIRDQACEVAGLDSRDAHTDFRELLARDDIDAVMIATPDHWHVPISLAAARAGKDIYCEKPLTRTLGEGRILCDTIDHYGRILQVGTQQRSMASFRFACELVRNGRIGQLRKINVTVPPNSRPFPETWAPQSLPQGLDYDLWLGPAQWQPYSESAVHYNWHFQFNFSGGQMCNWGAHYLDMAQWGNGTDDTGPVEVEGQGVFPADNLFNTAAKVHVEYRYANGVLLYCDTKDIPDGSVRFEGDEGWIYATRSILEASDPLLLQSVILPSDVHLYNSIDHHQNFLDCVKTRATPAATVEIGHRSASLCHLGNIAMVLGRPLKWDPVRECFPNDEAAQSMVNRSMRAPWTL